jgi:DNA-binding response OmpR family regulator
MTQPLLILHVDDDPIFSGLVSRILHRNGFKVFSAADITAGWKLFNEIRFHACLLDINMPGGSGIDLGEKIRNRDIHIPIAYLSGEPTATVSEEVYGRGGGFRHFSKIADLPELPQMLRNLILVYASSCFGQMEWPLVKV